MTDNIMALPTGRLSLSRIVYQCDLTRTSGSMIPLGVMAEMTVGPIRVLGLIARTVLMDAEAAQIGHLVRRSLSRPFDFLMNDFDWAWSNTAPGQALQGLASRHTESVLFVPPTMHDVPRTIALALNTPAGPELAREELRKRRDDEFLALMLDTWPDQASPPSRDVSELAA